MKEIFNGLKTQAQQGLRGGGATYTSSSNGFDRSLILKNIFDFAKPEKLTRHSEERDARRENPENDRDYHVKELDCHSTLRVLRSDGKCRAAFTRLVKHFRSDSSQAKLAQPPAQSSQTKFRSAHLRFARMQAHKPQQSFGCSLCNSYGFTLAETMIVIIVLGIIATLTIPALVNKQRESVARTKVRKAMSAYDLAIQKMTIENDLKSDTALISWAGNQDNNCVNSTQYFKKSQDINGCTFKTSDGLWWNISDITHPVISMKKIDENINGQTLDDIKTKADNQNDLTAFYLVTTYNPETGAFRTDDLAFEEKLDNTSADYLRVKKLYMLTKGVKGENNITQPLLTKRQCSNMTIDYDYNDKGGIASKKFTYNTGTSSGAYFTYEYDDYGNIVSIKNYDKNGNEQRKLTYNYTYENGKIKTKTFYNNDRPSEKEVYDEKGNVIEKDAYCGMYSNCSGNPANVYYHYVMTYDDRGNMLSEESYNMYKDGSLGNYFYNTYDDNNNIISERYKNGSSTGNYRYDGYDSTGTIRTKYEYDNNGNLVSTDTNDMIDKEYYTYDLKGNKTRYFSCSGGSCNVTKYEYDNNNNISMIHSNCDTSGNNCEYSEKYEYDENTKNSNDLNEMRYSKYYYCWEEDGDIECEGEPSSQCVNTWE